MSICFNGLAFKILSEKEYWWELWNNNQLITRGRSFSTLGECKNSLKQFVKSIQISAKDWIDI